MLRRTLIVAVGFVALLALLGQVEVDTAALAQDVPRSWWWSGVLPLIAGSAMPALFGIAMVMATRKLLLSLASGTLLAALLVSGPNPVHAVSSFVGTYLWGAVWDPFHAAVLAFTVSLIGLVSVANAAGGTHGVVTAVQRWAKGLRGARFATAVMGLAVFFDDYANTAIVGPTMRPLFDRLRLSREKLAYLIDSTAAPVAGLALVSTWVGAEVGYLQQAAEAVGVTQSGYAIFLSALGYRFYCIFTIMVVLAVAWTGRDFGPMYAAEVRALSTGQVVRPGATPLSGGDKGDAGQARDPRWYNAVVPIGVVMAIIVTGIYVGGAPAGSGVAGIFAPSAWQDAFIAAGDLAGGNFTAYLFAVAALAGSAVAIAMPAAQGVLSVDRGVRAWAKGARSMTEALAVLVLAWSLAAACSDLHTAKYVGTALSGIGAAWVPLVVFLVAGLVAFATGTSWGTMGILVPTAGAVAYHAGGEGVMVVAMAAVLDGAIFGDHCSPISDTTVLSSICAGSDHIDHVKTQIPYAVLGAGVAGVFGYSAVAAGGLPHWAGYLAGAVAVVALIRWLGRRAEDAPEVVAALGANPAPVEEPAAPALTPPR